MIHGYDVQHATGFYRERVTVMDCARTAISRAQSARDITNQLNLISAQSRTAGSITVANATLPNRMSRWSWNDHHPTARR